MESLNYLVDHILYQTFKIILNIFKKKQWEKTGNLPIIIYINNIENKITFKIKPGCHLKLLTPETMKLLGSTKAEVSWDENGKNVSHLEITKVVLVHCNIVKNDCQQDAKVSYIWQIIWSITRYFC